MDRIHCIAFTHKKLPLEVIGKMHVGDDRLRDHLENLKAALEIPELMYLSTCNRVELFLAGSGSVDLAKAVSTLLGVAEGPEFESAYRNAEMYHGEDAVKHLFRVSASLDSMVIGEREIITQVRKSYDRCREWGLTGDTLRLMMRKNVETAKRIFTETGIFRRPVSVVSLAYHRLKDLNFPEDSRVVLVGAGKTNRTMAKFLSKHGYTNLTIFNRTIERAKALVEQTGGKALPLEEIGNFNSGFDVLITCTGADEPVITSERYQALLAGDDSKKVIIDLAVPGDVDPDILENHSVKMIDVARLKRVADKNMRERENEVEQCEAIVEEALANFEELHRVRQMELAMQDIPKAVKDIREKATSSVFAKDLSELDEDSRDIVERMLDYMEKKYISVPMRMAREVMLNKR